MPDTFTANYSFGKPEVGSARNQWGVTLNNSLDLIDAQMKSTDNNADSRLKLDGTTPMTGSITFAGDNHGLIFSEGTVMFDALLPNGNPTFYADMAGSSMIVRTSDGTGVLFQVDAKVCQFLGQDVLTRGDGSYIASTGGIASGPIEAPNFVLDGNSQLYISGGNVCWQVAKDAQFQFNRPGETWAWSANGDEKMTLDGTGMLAVSNGIAGFSDLRLKNNVRTIDNGLDLISAIRPVSFNFTKDNRFSLGVIAQELEQVLPHAVSTNADDLKLVKYLELIAPLIAAVQELTAKVKALEAVAHG